MGSTTQGLSEEGVAMLRPRRDLGFRLLAVLAIFMAFSSTAAASPGEQGSARLAIGSAEEAPSRGKFLIASRNLVEPTFARRVVLLLDYDEMGGIGLVINRPTSMALAQVVPGMEQFAAREDYIRSGGPVERNRLFMLMRAEVQPPGTQQLLRDTYGSSTLHPLRELVASGRAESAEFIVFAGYAGWAPGQLEAEIERGDWHVAPGRSEHVFNAEAAEVWPRLIRVHGGRWVEGPHPPSGLADAMSLVRPVHVSRMPAFRIHDGFSRRIGAFAEMTGSVPGATRRHFRESADPPAAIATMEDERSSVGARFRHRPAYPNSDAAFRGGNASQAGEGSDNCASSIASCNSPIGAEAAASQGLKLSKSLSLRGPVTMLQYHSPSRASLLPGT